MAVVGDNAPRVIAEISDYSQLIGAMRLRAQERQIALGGEHVAHVAGLPVGYLQKLIGLQQQSRQNIRRIGIISLGPVLSVLGVRLVMIEDAEAIARYGGRIPRRHQQAVRDVAVNVLVSRRHFAKIGRSGGTNSRAYMSKKQASALGRKAVKARWAKRKQNGHGAASRLEEIAP